MTTHLFSRLVSELTSDISPSGIQQKLLSKQDSELNHVQAAGLVLFWNGVASVTGQNGANLDPSTVMAVMAGLPEVYDVTDDFFFI